MQLLSGKQNSCYTTHSQKPGAMCTVEIFLFLLTLQQGGVIFSSTVVYQRFHDRNSFGTDRQHNMAEASCQK